MTEGLRVPPRRILVIGASGLVGRHLLAAAADAGHETAGTRHSHPETGLLALDIRDAAAMRALIQCETPDIVFLTAAAANVDGCEADPAAFRAVNVDGTANVAAAAVAVGAKLVFFSSDYVFDGAAGPYAEDAEPRPLQEYGRQKLAAERLLRADALILRTTVVYGEEPAGKNFIARLRRTLAAGEQLIVPGDQIGTPTPAADLAQAALELALQGETGVFHVVGPDRVDRYAFAVAAAERFGLDASLIRPVSTAQLAQPAARPLDAGMSNGRAQALLPFPLRGVAAGLAALAA